VTRPHWQPLIKPAILLDIFKLPERDAQHIFAKIALLVQDPLPDGKTKRQVKYLNRQGSQVYRLRSGRYRIFYTLERPYVNILTIRLRDDDTYKEDVETDTNEADLLADDLDLDVDELIDADEAPYSNTPLSYPMSILNTPVSLSKPLPEPITVELLNKLQVRQEYYTRLLRIQDQNALLECPGVDEETLLRIDEYMFDRPLAEVMEQPDLILREVDDLLRYKEGELLTFLLKLSPEQERYARWSPQTIGPTLVKGSPGTGKSTVALYRIRSLLEQLLKNNESNEPGEKPCILFTTYTKALVEASKQLLQQLLGPDAQYVCANTADNLAFEIVCRCGAEKEIIDEKELRQLTRQAVAEAKYNGRPLHQFAQTLERIDYDYLLQELNTVIVARQLTTLDAYLQTPRRGRKLRLSATMRTALWCVYERWCTLLTASGKETWQQRRARAASLVNLTHYHHAFDAVVIDEAQDLDPSILRMLIQLCKATNRLFITADANQSIYGSGFNWSDVHRDLKFQGRTSILRANYRSTAEIGEAARSYIAYDTLETVTEDETVQYIHNGPIPDVRAVNSYQYEVRLLTEFFKQASRSLRLTLSSCAILCPNKNIGQALAQDLSKMGMEATYMEGRDLNLASSGIKILTLASSKGLEFPIVALAGFLTEKYPPLKQTFSIEEREELLARERRVIYVGMTRAMRALLVVVPLYPTSDLLRGFDGVYWNIKGVQDPSL